MFEEDLQRSPKKTPKPKSGKYFKGELHMSE